MLFLFKIQQGHLMTTWKYLRTTEATEEAKQAQSAPSTSSNAHSLSRVEKLLLSNRQCKPSDNNDMEKKLRRIPLDLSLPLDADVISYWDKRKREDKDLSQLALTALQLPCTQVSVERSFNGLSQILTKTRMNLGSVSLEKILFLKSNKDMLEANCLEFEVEAEDNSSEANAKP